MAYVPKPKQVTPISLTNQKITVDNGASTTVVINGVNAAIQFEDEGNPIGGLGTVSSVDFVGSGVTATAVGNAVTVTIPGGGGGAPLNAEYVVTSPDATLTSERVTTNTTQVLWDTTTPGQLKANVGAIAQLQVTGLVTDLAGKQGNITFADEGAPLAAGGVITSVNFTGGGVTASAIGTAMTVNVPTPPSGAPVNAQYIVSAADATLTNERVTTDTAEILWDTSTAGQLKATVGAITEGQVTGLVTDLSNKQGNLTFKDEGSALAAGGVITSIDFVGGGVTASAIGSAATVTIPEGAPISAQYVVTQLDGALTNERLTTDTAEVLWDTATAGALKATIGAVAQSKVTNLVTDLADKQKGLTFKDEGSTLAGAGVVTNVDFIGAGVTASVVGTTMFVNVAGGGGSSAATWDYLYGDGSDGNLTVTGAFSLNNNWYYQDVTVTGTGILRPVGNRMHVNGTLTIQNGGRIHTDGNAATGGAGGAALTATSIVLGTSGTGASGILGPANGTAATGTLTLSPTNPSGVTAKGGTGGASGVQTGGAGYTPTSALWFRKPNIDWQWGFQVKTVGGVWTGGGGGGSGGATVGQSGGGGGGASNMWIAARNISNSGTISCNGGAGGNAPGANAGGGGGGGGGLIWLITKTPYAAIGTVTVNGGVGGTATGTSSAGGTGTAGSIVFVNT